MHCLQITFACILSILYNLAFVHLVYAPQLPVEKVLMINVTILFVHIC